MFKIGQKVVCIKPDDFGLLVKDDIYTVSEVKFDGAIKVYEVFSEHIHNGFFNSWRFREIDDTWVEQILCKLMS